MPYLVLDPSTAEAAPASTAGAPLTSVGETLASFREDLTLELGNRTDISATQLDKWINWGYRKLSSMLTLKELFSSLGITTVADQPFYGLPTSLAWIQRVGIIDDVNFLAGGRELEQIDPAEYRLLADNTAEPTSQFRFARMLVLWPTPDSGYDLSIDFRVRVQDLDDDTDSPILPEEFHEVILAYARSRAWRALRNYPEAAVAQNDAVNGLRVLLNTDAQEIAAAEAGVQPVRSKSQLYQGRGYGVR